METDLEVLLTTPGGMVADWCGNETDSSDACNAWERSRSGVQLLFPHQPTRLLKNVTVGIVHTFTL
jgi:hypothetical protein